MTTAAWPTGRTSSPLDVVALQYTNRMRLFGVPAIILSAVVVLSVLIGVAILRSGGSLGDMAENGGVAYGIVGYMVALGVQNVTATFPFALALGTTRGRFVAGNLLTTAAIAVTVTAGVVVLLGLEVATGGWFIGAHVVRVDVLDDGSALGMLRLALGIATAVSVGSLFGAAWTRFGPIGPSLLGIGVALVVAIGLLLFLPQLIVLAHSFQLWWLAVAAGVAIAVSIVGQYLLLRGASVR